MASLSMRVEQLSAKQWAHQQAAKRETQGKEQTLDRLEGFAGLAEPDSTRAGQVGFAATGLSATIFLNLEGSRQHSLLTIILRK